MTPSKARRVTPVQQEMLLQFMQENPDFAARRASNPLSRAHYDKKWEELAITLNGGGEGSQKSVAEWRKTWSDWRKNVRLKASGAKDPDGKSRDGSRSLTGVERRLLDLVGAGTPPKQTKRAVTPVTVAPAALPAVYALPQPILPQPPPTNFSSLPSTNFLSSSTSVFPGPPVSDDDVEVLEQLENDPENLHTAVTNSKDGCQESRPAFPCQAAEPGRVGVGVSAAGVAAAAAAAAVEGGRGGWRPSSLQERRLALEERRLLLDERRLRLEERRVQHEEWRASMERETHAIDMDMKRALLKHMRQTESK